MPLPWLIGAAIVGGIACLADQAEKKRIAREQAMKKAERDYPYHEIKADDAREQVYVYGYSGEVIATYYYWPKKRERTRVEFPNR